LGIRYHTIRKKDKIYVETLAYSRNLFSISRFYETLEVMANLFDQYEQAASRKAPMTQTSGMPEAVSELS
jgi:hypothetical protein